MKRLTRSRLVDIITNMSTRERQPDRKTIRRIIGFSLSPDMARAVKTEAAKRGLSLRKLFEEMWALYEKSKPKARS